MSKSDRIKSQIDYLKAIIIFLGTAVFAVIGWCVTQRKSLEAIDFILGSFSVIALGVAIVFLHKFISKKFDDLGAE